MKNYIEVHIQNITEAQQNILIALLESAGFSGFQEEEMSLMAFINEEDFDEKIIEELSGRFNFKYAVNQIKEQNWNALWESNFEPVIVDDFVIVRAHFHQPDKTAKHEIRITPKMSFGTGHHATTYMMMQQMRDLDFTGKSVFDFGTGTGILAILAEQLGAKKIFAVDNDDWSIANAKENILANNCSLIEIKKVENAVLSGKFDIVLANINKNVILENATALNDILDEKSGKLLLSGLLKDDESDILEIFSHFNLQHKNTIYKNQWICMLWSRIYRANAPKF